ncbi:PQQ-like beta-propeller repeat protein [Rubripirellula sp.]|nr:PQQ-binding-like beta-propeller repeat protein [Rubripirellula sp.]MDB4634471.1 PQQ-like beta-propeller repeat protein [Rubripirellula sp.]
MKLFLSRNTVRSSSVLVAVVLVSSFACADHQVLLQGGTRLAIVDADGSVSWEMPWGGIHDIHRLENGNILTRQGRSAVVEIDPDNRKVIWKYDAAKENGNAGKRVEVHAFERLADGTTMIAESGVGRIIEVDRDGKLIREIALERDRPDAHSDTRLVRSTDSGSYLVAHEADGKVREYDRKSGKVIWVYEVPMFGKSARNGHGPEAFGNRLFAALRLKNGNTLVATGNGHSVLEVTPEKKIVWQVNQDDLPGIRLAWVTTLEVLPNGNYVIGNCHAGPGQPLLVEVEPKTKKVVWQFDHHADFGNNMSNSLLLDVAGESLR